MKLARQALNQMTSHPKPPLPAPASIQTSTPVHPSRKDRMEDTRRRETPISDPQSAYQPTPSSSPTALLPRQPILAPLPNRKHHSNSNKHHTPTTSSGSTTTSNPTRPTPLNPSLPVGGRRLKTTTPETLSVPVGTKRPLGEVEMAGIEEPTTLARPPAGRAAKRRSLGGFKVDEGGEEKERSGGRGGRGGHMG